MSVGVFDEERWKHNSQNYDQMGFGISLRCESFITLLGLVFKKGLFLMYATVTVLRIEEY